MIKKSRGVIRPAVGRPKDRGSLTLVLYVRIDKETHARLEKLSKKTNVKMSEWARCLIRRGLDKETGD